MGESISIPGMICEKLSCIGKKLTQLMQSPNTSQLS